MRQAVRKSDERGFTLVEIMVVVAIISLLAVLAIPNALRARTLSMESLAINGLRTLRDSIENYHSVNQQYPSDVFWQLEMYVNADPPYGPVHYNVDIIAGDVVTGYQWFYTRLGDHTYTFRARPTAAVSGGRSFWISEAGEIHYCTAPPVGDASATCPALTEPPVACGC